MIGTAQNGNGTSTSCSDNVVSWLWKGPGKPGQFSLEGAKVQTRRAVQEFLLLINRPDSWVAVHPTAGITAKGVRLWAAWWREQIRLRSKLRRPNLSPQAITAAQDDYENTRKADRIVQRAAWDGRLRRIVRGWILEKAALGKIEALASASKSLGIDPKHAFSVITNPRYLDALPSLPSVAARRRMMICAVPDCGRAFVRAVSKPAQKDCPRCRRRWAAKERWAIKRRQATRNRDSA